MFSITLVKVWSLMSGVVLYFDAHIFGFLSTDGVNYFSWRDFHDSAALVVVVLLL